MARSLKKKKNTLHQQVFFRQNIVENTIVHSSTMILQLIYVPLIHAHCAYGIMRMHILYIYNLQFITLFGKTVINYIPIEMFIILRHIFFSFFHYHFLGKTVYSNMPTYETYLKKYSSI